MDVLWDRLAYPRLCGLIGAKPSRLSQAMHNAAFRHKQLPFVYCAFNTTDTAHSLSAMRELGFRGLSLTIPHKETAVALVDEVGDGVAEIAAINTVLNNGGQLVGLNTDWFGVRESLLEAKFEARGAAVLVFGAGGAARAALYALKQLAPQQITIINRSNARAKRLAEEFEVDFLPYESATEKSVANAALFINATPLGLPLAGAEQTYPFDLKVFTSGQTVFDMVTKNTPLLETAQAQGAAVIAGVRMLLHQALKQFEHFTGEPPPREVMEEALNDELSHLR